MILLQSNEIHYQEQAYAMPKSNPRTSRIFAILLFASFLLIAAVIFFWPKPSMEQQAKVYEEGVTRLRANTLYSLVSSQERTALKCTEDEIRNLVENYLRPRLSQSEAGPSLPSTVKQKGMRNVPIARTVKRRPIVLEGLIYPSPDGPKGSVTEDIVLMGLTLDAALNNPKGTGQTLYQDALPTLDKAMGDLRATGLPGIYEASSGNVILWDVFEARFRDIARFKRQNSK